MQSCSPHQMNVSHIIHYKTVEVTRATWYNCDAVTGTGLVYCSLYTCIFFACIVWTKATVDALAVSKLQLQTVCLSSVSLLVLLSVGFQSTEVIHVCRYSVLKKKELVLTCLHISYRALVVLLSRRLAWPWFLVSTMSPWPLVSAIWSWRGLATTWSSRVSKPLICCYFGHLGLSLLLWALHLSAWRTARYMQWII